jgi:hypothetical protein
LALARMASWMGTKPEGKAAHVSRLAKPREKTIAGNRWKKIRTTLAEQRAATMLKHQRTKYEVMAAEAHKHVELNGITTHVDIDFDEEHPRLHLQGDLSMYTPQMLMLRHNLRVDPLVVTQLDRFWNIEEMFKVQGTDAAGHAGLCVTQAAYMGMMLRFHKLLLEEDEDEADGELAMLKTLQEDWVRDCEGHESLSQNLFRRALFELADMWVDGIQAKEYAWFLKHTLEHMAESWDPSKPFQLHWLPVPDICFWDVHAEQVST